MKANFPSANQIQLDLQEDFGLVWQELDQQSKNKFIKARQKTLKSKYRTHKDVVTKIGEVRRDQSQLYLGIAFGLSGGIVGSILDRWFGEYILFSIGGVFFFVSMVFAAHKAYQSSVKDISGFIEKK